jgi:hypothetical protein
MLRCFRGSDVVLTPLIGGHTLESPLMLPGCVMANLHAFFGGEPLPYAVAVG